MGYKVKWVEENLGVTRKMLRVYEDNGLMPKNNPGAYRDYDDDDIDRIWFIKVLQGMDYTLKEIRNMISDENFNFDELIAEKILKLEEEKKKIERRIGYAKTIKLTGRFPARPKKMGEMKFDDFQKKALEGWNITDDPQGTEYARFADTILSKSPEEWTNSDLGCMLSTLTSMITMDTDLLLAGYILPKAIVKRKHLGASHPDIQCMIKIIYENQNALIASTGRKDRMTIQQFSRFYSSGYLVGDIAKINASEFTKEECEFIAEAFSIFGGYTSFEELIKSELQHGR